MCTGIEIAALVTAFAGAGISGYSAYESGQSQKKAGEYNAKMGELKAQDALQRGADEAGEIRARARRVASGQAEAGAMSNVDISSGTPLALLTETAGLGELDALRTINNAEREAWGQKAQSELDLFQGNAAGRAGKLNAGGTFLTSAANTYFGAKAMGGGSGMKYGQSFKGPDGMQSSIVKK